MLRFRPDSVVARVVDDLRRRAEEAGPGAKLPTVRTLRQELGISHAPLESALGQLEREGVIERKQGAGIFVRERINQLRCAVVFEASFLTSGNISPFWPILLRTINLQAKARGWEPVIHFTLAGSYSDEKDMVEENALPMGLINELRDQHINALITVGLVTSIFNYLDQFGLPIAAFAGYGRRRVVMLAERWMTAALGCAMADGFSAPLVYSPGAFTEGEYEEAIRATLSRPKLVSSRFGAGKWEPMDGRDDIKSGYDAAWGINLDELRERGIVSVLDVGTLGLLMGLRRRGLEPHRDFRMYTHANVGSSLLLGWAEEVVRIEYEPDDLVEGLFDLLEAQVAGIPPRRCLLVPSEVRHLEPDWVTPVMPRVIRPAGLLARAEREISDAEVQASSAH